MPFPIFQVDAFTSTLFAGNPAAVCPLETWLSDETLLNIAAENNLSETAFYIRTAPGKYALRWFAPGGEVDLCGHATLAAAFMIFRECPALSEIRFATRSGELVVAQETDGNLSMQFPAREGLAVPTPDAVQKMFPGKNVTVCQSRDCMAVLEREEDVCAFIPDTETLLQLDGLGFIITAPGKDCDIVSRCFYPKVGVLEDPVTGSAHCTIIPYWAKRLKKTSLHARQLSARGGDLWCVHEGDVVTLKGKAVLYMEGVMHINP
jgi:PhzF family phenazine biosynthesis protein